MFMTRSHEIGWPAKVTPDKARVTSCDSTELFAWGAPAALAFVTA
jgi:hypothetical protein